MNDESKQYHKTVGAAYCDQTRKWNLACAERTAGGIQIKGFASVSDGIAIVSEVEKLSQVKLHEEQSPLLISLAADTAQMGFYPFSIPVVDGPRQEALILAQAEAILPMPLAQSMFSWRIVQRDSTVQHGFLSAVRRGYFQELAGLTSGRTGSVMPDATGLVRAWGSLFESANGRCVLVKIRKNNCVLAVCQDGKLVRAAGLDRQDDPGAIVFLAREMLNLAGTLDIDAMAPFYITGPESPAGALCNELKAHGKTASLWKLSPDKLRSLGLNTLAPEVLLCPEAAGIALAAMDTEPAEFDLIRKPAAKSTSHVVIDKRLLVKSVIWAAAVLVLFLVVFYWTTKRELSVIRDVLAQTHQDTTGEKLLARQQMRERYAKARPDMLELLTALNISAGNDVMIDTFNFKKGQPVRLTAKTGSFERVYAFQKKLQEQSGISGVKLISPTKDERKNQVQFTLTFNYKNFSR